MIEKLTEYIKFVALEIDNSVKTHQQKVTKNIEIDWLENALIFEINDKLIFGVNTPLTNKNWFSISGLSIVLNP